MSGPGGLPAWAPTKQHRVLHFAIDGASIGAGRCSRVAPTLRRYADVTGRVGGTLTSGCLANSRAGVGDR